MAEPTANPTQQKSERKADTGQASTAQGAIRSDRERGMETAREGSRAQRGTGIQRRGGAVAPYTGPIGTPFGMMCRMMDDMDRLFENFGFARSPALSTWPMFDDIDTLPRTRQAATLWSPPIEIFERGSDLVVRADLPGLSKDDVMSMSTTAFSRSQASVAPSTRRSVRGTSAASGATARSRGASRFPRA